MSWILLGLGIALEVAGTLCMKASDGFADWRAAVLMYVFYGMSLTTLTFAFSAIDVSVGYAVWSGAGLLLVVLAGMLWFGESASLLRLAFITMILVGLLGLHLLASPGSDGRRG